MENNRYRLCDVEEAVEEMDLMDVPDDLVETEEGEQLVVSGWYVKIESLSLNLRQGIICIWDPKTGMLLPESDVAVISEGDIEKQEWICYIQAGFAAAVALWLDGRLPDGQIEQLWCELILPESGRADESMENISGKRGTVYEVCG